MLLFILLIYSSNLTIWRRFFNKDEIILNFVASLEQITSTTNKLMNNLLIMIYNNKTLDDFSETVETKDYISFIYNKLKDLYYSGKLFNKIKDIISINTDENTNFDCLSFYNNLDNELFNELKKKFINEGNKIHKTFNFLCYLSNVMIFKSYKTIYLQLFNKVKTIMEKFKNFNYNEIILFFNKNEIITIEITFLITYIYIMDLLSNNVQISVLTMMKRMKNNIIRTAILFYFLLIFIILIIIFVYVRNIKADCKKFIFIKKVFKVCNINE